jgi:heme a synthase
LDSYRFFVYANVFCIYATIVVGGYVASTNSGLACPDWPTCNGNIIPVFTTQVIIEYTHRLVALLAGVFYLAVTVFTWLRFRASRRLVATVSLGFLLLVAQIFLGMVTVETALQPAIVAVHLGLATAVFGFALSTAYLAHRQ